MTTAFLTRLSARSLAAVSAIRCLLITLGAQTYDDVILAGAPGRPGFKDGRGSEARVLFSSSGTLDVGGNLYLAAAGAIRRITPAGEVTTVAGDDTGDYGYRDDRGRGARFTQYEFPIAADRAGNLYAADRVSHTIRKITPSGNVTTFAGLAGARGYADGLGTAARFNEPTGVAVDRAGRVFVSDAGNRVIRLITPAGNVTTFAGQVDPVTQGRPFRRPVGLAFDGVGRLYVADADELNNHTFSAVSPEGRVTATNWGSFGNATPYTNSEDDKVVGIGFKVDSAGNLYVSTPDRNWIRRFSPEGRETIQLHPAAPVPSGAPPIGLGLLAVRSDGTVYLSDNAAIRKRTPDAAAAAAPIWSEDTMTADYGTSGVTYGNRVFVIAGGVDSRSTGSRPLVYSCPDGLTWTQQYPPALGAAFAPRFAGGRFFVAVKGSLNLGDRLTEVAGDTVILSSADGVNWRSSGLITRENVPVDAPVDFAHGNGTFVAVSDTRTNASPLIFTSSDGVRWIPRPIDGAVGPATTASITFFRGHFYVAVSSGPLLRSVDGIEWTRVATAPAGPRYLAASAEALVVVAFDGPTPGLWRSSDGDSFAPVAQVAGRISGRIQFLDGAFVTAEPEPAAGPETAMVAIRASYDGRTWTTVARVATRDGWSIDVARGHDRYVVTAGKNVFLGATDVAPGGVAASVGHLGNVSILARAGPETNPLTMGVTLGGATDGSTRNLLVRGVAPTLAQFGVTGTLADPRLKWMSQSTVLAANNDWNGNADLGRAASVVGAFPLAADSKDAATLLWDVPPGSYTVHVTGHDDRSGLALAEIYALPGAGTAISPRITNFSARAPVGTGNEILVAGFEVHSGEARLLIRASGPALEVFGVPGILGDPQLAVYRGATLITANDDWSNADTPSSAQTRVGAFAFEPGSKDAALIATLSPGTYTVQISGIDGAMGVALFEIFELR